MKYTELERPTLEQELKTCRQTFEELKGRGLKLDMSRGKPGKAQLDLVSDILTVVKTAEECVVDGTDVRNYGVLAGLPAAQKLFAEILNRRLQSSSSIHPSP